MSLKAGEVSLFTLDGRMRFKVDLSPETERRFREDKLREIVLAQVPDGAWALTFDFTPAKRAATPTPPTRTGPSTWWCHPRLPHERFCQRQRAVPQPAAAVGAR